jgi:hypothetical protein
MEPLPIHDRPRPPRRPRVRSRLYDLFFVANGWSPAEFVRRIHVAFLPFSRFKERQKGEPLLLATLWYQRKRTGGKSGGTRSRTTGERGEGDDKNSTPHPPTPLHPSRFHCPCRSKEQTHTQKKGGDAPQLPYSAPQGHSDPKFPIRPLLVLVVADDEDGATDRATSPAGEPATPRRRPGEGGRR